MTVSNIPLKNTTPIKNIPPVHAIMKHFIFSELSDTRLFNQYMVDCHYKGLRKMITECTIIQATMMCKRMPFGLHWWFIHLISILCVLTHMPNCPVGLQVDSVTNRSTVWPIDQYISHWETVVHGSTHCQGGWPVHQEKLLEHRSTHWPSGQLIGKVVHTNYNIFQIVYHSLILYQYISARTYSSWLWACCLLVRVILPIFCAPTVVLGLFRQFWPSSDGFGSCLVTWSTNAISVQIANVDRLPQSCSSAWQ